MLAVTRGFNSPEGAQKLFAVRDWRFLTVRGEQVSKILTISRLEVGKGRTAVGRV
jgi:hypothetical protein